MIENDADESSSKTVQHGINYSLSIKEFITGTKEGFPQSMKELNESDFIANSRQFVRSLILDKKNWTKCHLVNKNYANTAVMNWFYGNIRKRIQYLIFKF